MQLLRDWYDGVARNNQLALLLTLLAVGTIFVVLTAHILAPFYAAVTIAYVLQVAMDRMQRRGLSKRVALAIAFGLFIAAILALLGLIPLLVKQLAQLADQVPAFAAKAQATLQDLPQRYPALVNDAQIDVITNQVRESTLHFGQRLAGYAGATVVGFVALLVYLIIVPIMVFFLLKDKDRIVAWFASFLPAHHELAAAVWADVHRQLQNFVGGKVLQMLIVAVVSFIVFRIIGLDYAPLLAAIIGVAVQIPYIGSAFATVPVMVVATLQWGFTLNTLIALGAYGLINALDGNVLVPFLFAEAVAIHPVAIIGAILFFGGIWGLWGVFFAIPLAVVVKAVLQAWPRRMPPVTTPSS
jgi:putative permease